MKNRLRKYKFYVELILVINLLYPLETDNNFKTMYYIWKQGGVDRGFLLNFYVILAYIWGGGGNEDIITVVVYATIV